MDVWADRRSISTLGADMILSAAETSDLIRGELTQGTSSGNGIGEGGRIAALPAVAVDDEREGKPSASDMEANKLCLGRRHQCRGRKSPGSEDAESGDRIHAWLSGKEVILSDDEEATAGRCVEYRLKMESEVFGARLNDASLVAVLREERLWDKTHSYSGKPDYVLIIGDVALIVDYKTGHLDVTEPASNYQLRVLSVLVWQNFPQVKTVYAAIVAPWLKRQPPVCYTLDDLQHSEAEITDILNAQTDDAPLTPGDKQCKYCAAKLDCPAATGTAVAVVEEKSVNVAALSGAELAQRLRLVSVAKQVIKAWEQEAKLRLKSGIDAPPGWTLSDGKTLKEPDALEVWTRLAGASLLTAPQFTACCKVGLEKLKKALKEHAGLKGKALDVEMERLLDGCPTKQTEGSLEEIK